MDVVSSRTDEQLVTEVDKAVEVYITEKIKAAYPDHKLYVHLFISYHHLRITSL
jgi:fructose-1,6-bisphosphatase/inositol monophosphatase family enzyme